MTARLRVRGWLRLVSPVHVGGSGHDPNGPMELAVNGKDWLCVPGTSLAGPLRAQFGSDQVRFWGFVEPRSTNGQASRIVIRDALVTQSTEIGEDGQPNAGVNATIVESRTGVGIDRFTGAAVPGILYERLVLPAALFLRFEVDVESNPEQLDADRGLLAAMLCGLADGQVRLGSAKTRGLGRVVLCAEDLSVMEQRLDSPTGLVEALRGDGRRWTLAELRTALPDTDQRHRALIVEIGWTPRTPVMVRDPIDGVSVDIVPLTTVDAGGATRLLLPGSSIKGVLRSRAEYIVRTVNDIDLTVPTGNVAERAADFRKQHTAMAIVNALFGAPPPTAKDVASESWYGVGAVSVDDCLSETEVPAELWRQLFTADGASDDGRGEPQPDALRDALAGLGIDRTDHVAIDRWTGGAAEGRLFSVLEPHSVRWQALRLEVDLGRLVAHPGALADAALALLLLVLRDVRAGRVPIGYGTHRGLGDLTVTALIIRGLDWPDGIDLDHALRTQRVRELGLAWQRYLTRTAGEPAT